MHYVARPLQVALIALLLLLLSFLPASSAAQELSAEEMDWIVQTVERLYTEADFQDGLLSDPRGVGRDEFLEFGACLALGRTAGIGRSVLVAQCRGLLPNEAADGSPPWTIRVGLIGRAIGGTLFQIADAQNPKLELTPSDAQALDRLLETCLIGEALQWHDEDTAVANCLAEGLVLVLSLPPAATPAPPAPAPPAPAPPAPAARTCTQWDVNGTTWSTEQSNGYHPSFAFRQTGQAVTGSATVPSGEASRAGYSSPTGPVSGTLVGDRLEVTVTWTRSQGAVQGQYGGNVANGRITNGTAGPVSWTGSGSASCASFSPA